MKFRDYLQKHGLILLILIILAIILTYPLMWHIITLNSDWVLGGTVDTSMKFWDAWHFEKVITSGQDYYYSSNLFYPDGLSLSYHSMSLPYTSLMLILDSILPTFVAFNLTTLMLLVFTLISGYIYIFYTVQNRWLSLFGACVWGFSTQVTLNIDRPDLSFLATIPLAFYFSERALKEYDWKLGIIAGLIAGSTALIGMYTFICLIMMLGIRFLMILISNQNWKNRQIWSVIIVFLIAFSAIALLRVTPMFTADGDTITEATQKYDELEVEKGADLFLLLINGHNPWLGTLQTDFWDANINLSLNYYISYVAIALIFIGILFPLYRRQTLSWMIIFLIFSILRLGSFLTINGVTYTDIKLPKYYLNQLISPIFEGFWVSGHFHIGAILPIAIMAVYGLAAIIQSDLIKRQWLKALVIILCTTLLLIEVYKPPFIKEKPANEVMFFQQLADQEHEQGAIINLPMGRGYAKTYLYHQTIHELPQVEGLASRTFNSAYTYINKNNFLRRWSSYETNVCITETQDSYVQTIDKLIQDNYLYVILHKDFNRFKVHDEEFSVYPPYYEDDYLIVYKLQDMKTSCMENPSLHNN